MSDEFNEIIAKQTIHELDTAIMRMCVHEAAARRLLESGDGELSEQEANQVGMIFAGVPLGGLLSLNLRTVHLLNVEREHLINALSAIDKVKIALAALMQDAGNDVRVPAGIMNSIMTLDAAVEKVLDDAPYKKVTDDDE
jgi:hypothetical protein